MNNTVGEIKGSEKPDEFVVVGRAHLDSRDLGQGATDNGTGSVTVLESARIACQERRQAETHHTASFFHWRRTGPARLKGLCRTA